jgi:hypothetical protein
MNAYKRKRASNGSLAGLLDAGEDYTLLAAGDPPTDADLAETIEVKFTEAINAKATELDNNPIKIYEWVRNNVEFVPTYGSIQGAGYCLQTLECNAFDTSSLLIALLRSSGVSSRYAMGTVEISIDKFMNWVGGFTDATAAMDFAASGGIPTTGLVEAGKVKVVRLEHVWVEAWVDMIPSMGAKHVTGDSWTPMDGSFKEYEYSAWTNMTTAVPFDQVVYLSSVKEYAPIEHYQNKIQDYLDTNVNSSVEDPEVTVATIKTYGQIIERKFSILPGTLSNKIVTSPVRSSSLPSGYSYSISFSISDPDAFNVASKSFSLLELSGERITISYLPASSTDEQLLNEYGGRILDVPAYLMYVKPVLKVGGQVEITGGPVVLGSDQAIALQINKPQGNSDRVNKAIVAGGYFAISLNMQGINEAALSNRSGPLYNNIKAGSTGLDGLTGEYLSSLAYTYFMANDKRFASAARIYDMNITRMPSEGIVSLPLIPSYVFSVPASVSPGGIEIDVALENKAVVARDGNKARRIEFLKLTGLESSFHEHELFEKILDISSVSAIKALQRAAVDGIPIHNVTSSNASQIIPVLQVEANIVNDVLNAVNAGMEVTLPERNVQIGDWDGIGYIVWDSKSGSGAYMISGGLAGGGSVNLADAVELAKLLIADTAISLLTAIKDVLFGASIAYGAEVSVGEIIVGRMEKYEGKITKYVDADTDCSGLVRRAHLAAGICIDSAKEPCIQSSLAKTLGITSYYGAEIHYGVAEALCMYGSIKGKDTFKLMKGDIVYFDYPGGKSIDHEGIVVQLPDENGTLKFIDTTLNTGARRSSMNFNDKDNLNARLLGSCNYPETNKVPCLASTLFKGYGTVREHPSLCGTH